MQLAVEIAADRDLVLALADDPSLAGTQLGSESNSAGMTCSARFLIIVTFSLT